MLSIPLFDSKQELFVISTLEIIEGLTVTINIKGCPVQLGVAGVIT